MSRPKILLDTGPLVALLSKSDSARSWTLEQFGTHSAPFLSCEAVLSEACFVLRRDGQDASGVLGLLDRGVIRIGMSLTEEASAVRKLFEKYGDLPTSLADACLIRMSELYDPCLVLTLDRDFHVYRRRGRQTIPLLRPSLR
ncbi:type II toxin-antitoxin system VapC family toxin [Panacagrimonas sp.]|uniref:type II toxin-antitoxin system VapC family toxin n=1 Tax=Panacagrimonas sp. TaxID=2480088 RepID=UPI003B518943